MLLSVCPQHNHIGKTENEVDIILRDHQADFRRDRGCIDQIATLRIIVERSMAFDSSFYVNFVDYETAFDSLERHKLLASSTYWIPENIYH